MCVPDIGGKGDGSFEKYSKPTRREVLLAEMNRIAPWVHNLTSPWVTSSIDFTLIFRPSIGPIKGPIAVDSRRNE